MENLFGFALLGAFGWLYAMLVIFAGLVGVAGTALWVWMLVEVLTRETDEGNNRLVWALVIVFTHWIGALIYWIVRRNERIAKSGR